MSSYRILTMCQTDVRFHPSVVVYFIYAWLTGHLKVTLVAFVSIMAHEIAHWTVAKACGYLPGSFEITPLGAVLKLDDEYTISPCKRGMIIIAGPMLTLCLAYVSLCMAKYTTISAETARTWFMSNLAILMMNVLPVWPLDGGRMLALLLDSMLPHIRTRKILRISSGIVGISMIILNVFICWKYGGWNLSLGLAGCCIIYSGEASVKTQAMEELRDFLNRKIALERKGYQRIVMISVLTNQCLRQLVKLLPPNRQAVFLCLEPGSMRICGLCHESELIQQYLNDPSSQIGDIINAQKLY